MGMTKPPDEATIARIVALEGDDRPGVSRLAMEALCAISGVEMPEKEPVKIIMRPMKGGNGRGAEC